MSEKTPALPEGQTHTNFNAPLEELRPNQGKDLALYAEAVCNTIDHMYQKAIDKRNYERRGIQDGELDKELVHLLAQDVPEAVEELGDRLEEARDIEENIQGRTPDTIDYSDNRAEKFLENYREAEGLYREAFKLMGREIGGQSLAEFLDDQYRIGLLDNFKEVPDPRPDHR
ncbi:hypothetical protein [Candidatus Nanohalovita haloferacivicina]|uniref:hypothetical protein n=1 Tax=Candidatus Nanohalovita haloferacivicina TaxID=2978046 RepID=UPI00325FBF81|nr:hypothetical protein HBNXNv_0990 [Candidatus Nanohalobia archaeon BNXNv]